jgi:hypothetical protein
MIETGKINLTHFIQKFEYNCIIYSIRTANGNPTEAAKLLGIKRTTMLEKIKKFGINVLDYSIKTKEDMIHDAYKMIENERKRTKRLRMKLNELSKVVNTHSVKKESEREILES